MTTQNYGQSARPVHLFHIRGNQEQSSILRDVLSDILDSRNQTVLYKRHHEWWEALLEVTFLSTSRRPLGVIKKTR